METLERRKLLHIPQYIVFRHQKKEEKKEIDEPGNMMITTEASCKIKGR